MANKTYEMQFILNAALNGGFNAAMTKAQQEFSALGNEISALSRVQSDISAYSKQQSAVEKTSQKLENLKEQSRLLQVQIEATAESEGEDSAATAALEREKLKLDQRIANTTSTLERQQTSLNNTSERLTEAGVDTSNLSEESARLSTEMSELQEKQQDAANSAASFGEETVAALDAVNSVITTLGLAELLGEVRDAFDECVTAAATFEETMSTVKALSGATAEEMTELNAKAKEIGATTKYTADEAAQAMSYMGMAGWDATEMVSGMDGVIALAAASGEDLAEVSDIVTDNLTAFGLTASDTAHFADVLAAAATNSNTSVSVMGETFKQSASIAGALGYSIEDVSVAVGLMANAGVKGSMAGTALKNTFNGLLEGATLTADAFGEYEFSALSADGTMKSFSETIDELRGYFSQMTEAERVNNAMAIAGKRSYNGLLAILNATDEDMASLTASIEDCTGAAQSMADIKLDNLNGQIALMESAADALKTTIGEQLSPTMEGLYSIATDVLTSVNGFVEQNPALVKSVTSFVAVIGTATAALTAYSAVAKVVKALDLASTFSNPVALAIMGVTAAVAAVTAGFAAYNEVMEDSLDESYELTAVSREQYYELQDLNAQYEEAVDTYGEASYQAQELAAQIDELTESYEANKETLEDAAAAHDALMEEYEAAASARNEGNSEIDLEAEKTQSLINRLEELSGSSADAAANQKEISLIVDELNEKLPGLDLSYEKVAGGVQSYSDDLEDYAENVALAQAAEQSYQDYINALALKYPLEREVEKNKANLDALKTQYAAASAALEQAYAPYKDENGVFLSAVASAAAALDENVIKAQAAFNALETQLDDAQTAYDESTAALDENQEALDETLDAYNDYTEQLDAANEAAEAEAEAEAKIAAQNEEVAEAVDATVGSLRELAEAYTEAYNSALESFQGQFGLFDEAEADMDATVANAQAALDSQLAYWTAYQANIETLKNTSAEDLGITQANYDLIMSTIQDGSTEAAGLAQSMVDALKSGDTAAVAQLAETYGKIQETQEQIAATTADWQTDFENQMQSIVDDMSGYVDDLEMSDEAALAAHTTIQAFIDEAAEQETAVRLAYSALGKAAADSFNINLSSGAGVGYSSAATIGGADVSNYYASGTTSAERGFAVVGEDGPELVFMRGGEAVIDAAETARLTESVSSDTAVSASLGTAYYSDGATNVNVAFNIEGGTSPEAAAAWRENADDFADKVMRVINDAKRDSRRLAFV